MTKAGTNPLPLWFDSPSVMDTMSNKSAALEATFKLLDTNKISKEMLIKIS